MRYRRRPGGYVTAIVCSVLGHQPNRRRVWNDGIQFRCACKRCGYPMLRDIEQGWRAFDAERDHDERRAAHPQSGA